MSWGKTWQYHTAFALFIAFFFSTALPATSCGEYFNLISSQRHSRHLPESFRGKLDEIYDQHLYKPVPDQDLPTLMKYFHVKPEGNFVQLDKQTQSSHLNSIFDYMTRMPSALRNKLLSEVDIFAVDKAILESESYRDYSLFTNDNPAIGRHFPNFSDSGAAFGIVIATAKANRSEGVILHELGHTADHVLGEDRLSETKEFLKAQKQSKGAWERSYYSTPRESIAEAIRRIYLSDETRRETEEYHPELFQYLMKRIPLPKQRLPLTGFADETPMNQKVKSTPTPRTPVSAGAPIPTGSVSVWVHDTKNLVQLTFDPGNNRMTLGGATTGSYVVSGNKVTLESDRGRNITLTKISNTQLRRDDTGETFTIKNLD